MLCRKERERAHEPLPSFYEAAALLHLPPHPFLPTRGVSDSLEAGFGIWPSSWCQLGPLPSLSGFSLLIGFMLLRIQPTASPEERR